MKNYLLKFSSVSENDGDLTYFEVMGDIPFEIKRIFSIYNVPNKKITRANHASINTAFVLQAVVGSVEVELDNGFQKECFLLNEIDMGLIIPKLTWMKTKKFSKSAVLNVYASESYENCKYVNDYERFLKMVNEDEKNCDFRSK